MSSPAQPGAARRRPRVSTLARPWRWLAVRWRQSLVLSLTLAAIGGVALLTLVIASVVARQIEDDGLARARNTAELLARSAFAPLLPREGHDLGRRELRTLRAQVTAVRASQPGAEVALREGDGRVLFATGGAALDEGLGAPGTRVVGSGAAKRVSATLRVRAARRDRPPALLQLELPYGPIAAEITSRTRRLGIVLALTALALYLLILPSLIKAGRAMRLQYDPRRLELARELKRAIRNGELSLAYQPIVASETAALHSVEALVRWTDPRRGPISPGTFIPALEQTDAIWPLTAWIFEEAFSQADEWRSEGRPLRVAVNLSAAVVLERRLVPELERLLARYRLPAGMVEIEITEGALLHDPDEATRVLGRIAELGLRVIAIDDFGTGYSSLARLHELPLHTLKIDQSFVRRMASEGEDAVVRSVIDLAHALEMDVIAEGVEDEATAVRLRELGAEYLQGYHFSRPLPAVEVARWGPDQRATAV